MSPFLLSEDEWYKQRDDRTNRLSVLKDIENYSIGVVVNSEIEKSSPLQLMTLLSLNMLSRWCRRLEIEIQPNIKCVLKNHTGETFQNVLLNILKDIDPYGLFKFQTPHFESCKQILSIGQTEIIEELTGPKKVWIDATGWISGIGEKKAKYCIDYKNMDQNPVGPAFASCIGNAQLFRNALQIEPTKKDSVWYSLYDFTQSSNFKKIDNPNYERNRDFGRVYQIGCGAVASSLDFLLSLTDWKAELHLIDFDKVDVTNCNRSLSFFSSNIGESKVDACAAALKSTKIACSMFNCDYNEYIRQRNYSKHPPDLVLSLANERNVWSTIQANYPPIVLHGTTTINWGVNFGRHLPKEEWCIMCRFSKDVKNEYHPPCSEGEITASTETPIFGVLPFLSPTSAVLIFAEMAKMHEENYPVNNNFIEFSMKTFGTDFITFKRKPQKGCNCLTQNLDIYLDPIKKSKFWRL